MTMLTDAPATRPAQQTFFTFPDPVNEKAVRVTAAGVVLMALLSIVLQRPEPLVALAYGFVARAIAGPRLSPLAQLASRVIAPRLPGGPKPVPGPPKRFAQLLGAICSVAAVLAYYALGWHTSAFALAGVMVLLATLESVAGICVGCLIHARLARSGIIRAPECAECADVSLRIGGVR